MTEDKLIQIARIFYTRGLEEALKIGLCPKKNLINRRCYGGHCRNAGKALWVEELQSFVYRTVEFGNVFLEYIKHPEDDDGFDLYITAGDILELSPEEQDFFDRHLEQFIKSSLRL